VENREMALPFLGSVEARGLAQKSYEEVLDATKHQDDKIGRFLTAIAFLFTGAIAFGTRSDLLDVRVGIGRRSEPLPALFLALFLTLSIVSVLLLIVAIGPNLSLPRGSRGHRIPSWLFFLWIASKTREEWVAQWRVTPSPGEVTRSFVAEAHNLALKTEFKYNRTNEARAVFTLGLMFLALAIMLFFEASVRTPPSNEPLEWSLEVRAWATLVISTFGAVLAYDQLRLSQDLGDYSVPGERVRLAWPLMGIVVAAPIYVASLLLPSSSGGRPLAFLGAMGAVGLANASIWVRHGGRKLSWPGVAHAAVILFGLTTVLVISLRLELAALWMCVGMVLLLEIPRLAVSSLTLHHRLQQMRPTGVGFGKTLKTEWESYLQGRGQVREE
jgi:hypothetical protein